METKKKSKKKTSKLKTQKSKEVFLSPEKSREHNRLKNISDHTNNFEQVDEQIELEKGQSNEDITPQKDELSPFSDSHNTVNKLRQVNFHDNNQDLTQRNELAPLVNHSQRDNPELIATLSNNEGENNSFKQSSNIHQPIAKPLKQQKLKLNDAQDATDQMIENEEEDEGLEQKFEVIDEFPDDFDDLKLNSLQKLSLLCKDLVAQIKKITQGFNEIIDQFDVKVMKLLTCKKDEEKKDELINLNDQVEQEMLKVQGEEQKVEDKQKEEEPKIKAKIVQSASLMCVFFFMLITMIVYIGVIADSTDKSASEGFDTLKKYIANNLIGGACLFTFYGIFFLQFGTPSLFIFLFLIQAIPSLIIFVRGTYATYVSKEEAGIPEPQYFVALFFFSLYFFWLAAFIIKHDLEKNFSYKVKNYFVILWCIIPGAVLIGVPAYQVCTTFDLNFRWGYKLLQIIGAPYILLLCLAWVYMHFRFLDPLLKKLQKPKQKDNANGSMVEESAQRSFQSNTSLNDDLDNALQNFSDLTRSVNFTKSLYLGRKKGMSFFRVYFVNYVVLFTSFVLGATMISLSIISILFIAHQLSLDDYLFMLTVIPFYVIIGTTLIYSNIEAKTKLILIPFFGGMIPILVCLPFSMVIDYFQEARPLKFYFALGPSAVALYWVSLVYLRINHWKLSMLFNGYFCLFVLVPVLYIIPTRDLQLYENYDNVAYVFQMTLLILGATLFVVIWLLDLVVTVIKNWVAHKKTLGKRKNFSEMDEEDEFTRSGRFELSNIFKYDLEDFGLWGNSFGYILTFTILLYFYMEAPEWVTEVQQGVMLGLQITIVYLFLCCLVILMMKTVPEQKREDLSFSEQVASIFGKHQHQYLRERQEKIKRLFLHIGFIDSPVIFILILLIFFIDSSQGQATCLTSIIGIILVSIASVTFLNIKKKFDYYSKTTIPALIVFCWFFLYMPFAGIIPSAIIYLSSDWDDVELQVTYERIVGGFIAILLMVGVALTTIIIHLFFKRRDFEKKFKFIANRIIKALAHNHVKSDYIVINLAYQGFVTKGEENARQTMQDGKKYIFWTKISKYDPNVQFSKMILDSETYKSKEEMMSKKKQAKENTFWDHRYVGKLFWICCCLIQQNRRQSILPLEEQQHLLMDNDDDEDDEAAFQRAQDEAIAENIKTIQEREEEDDQDEKQSWLKNYLQNINRLKFDIRILEPLRRYDLPQNLQVSKPWQSQFLINIFKMFAQGSLRKFDFPWMDYVMFKQLLVLSGLVPSRDLTDEDVDKIYAKFTAYERVANQVPITQDKFPILLTQIGLRLYPFDPAEDALGKLVKFWMFPFLLWYVVPMHGLYPHEWDYVLFLLKMYGMQDTYEQVMRGDIGFRKNLEKELGILPLDQQNLNPDLDQNFEKERWTLRKLMEYVSKYCRSFSDNILYFIKSHCLLERDQRNEGIDEVEMEVKMIRETILKPKGQLSKKKKIYKHPESPEWKEIVEIIIDNMIVGEGEWQRKKDEEFKNMKLRCNITNSLIIFFKFIEFFTFASLAFRPQIKWGLNDSALNFFNLFNTEMPNASYQGMFLVSILLILLYFIIAYRTVLRIRYNNYGNSEAKKVKNLISLDWFYIQSIHFLQHVLGFFMLKTMLDAFACDYAVNSIKCFESAHTDYFGLAVVGIIMIYPMTSFLFSNIQYQNKALDLKYDPTYYSLQGNVRFLVAVASAFFSHEETILYSLIFTTVLLILFGILTKDMKPCLLKKLNPLEMGGYLFSGWVHACAIVVILSDSAIAGGICMLIGFILIFLISMGYFKILHDKQSEARKKRLLWNQEGAEREYSSSSDNSESEDEQPKQSQEESLEFKIWKALNDFKQKKEMMGEWPEENYQFVDQLKKQENLMGNGENLNFDINDEDKEMIKNQGEQSLELSVNKNDISQDFMLSANETKKSDVKPVMTENIAQKKSSKKVEFEK